MPRPALFLDRDGTLNEEVHYLSDPAQVVLVPGAGEAVAKVNAAGIPVLVVSNQAGIARGFFPEERMIVLHRRLDELLSQLGAHVDGYYFCPHHPTEGIDRYRIVCACRKPKPGMLLQAAREHDIDLTKSIMIGDRITDLEAGSAAGCQSILVLTGYGAQEKERVPVRLPGYLGYFAALPMAIDRSIQRDEQHT